MSIAIARAKSIRVSHIKLGVLINSIRGLDVYQASLKLKFSKKRVASEVEKVLKSAVSNAENNFNMDIDNLFISNIYCGKYKKMKRFMARARGRASRIEKPFSNLTIELKERGQ